MFGLILVGWGNVPLPASYIESRVIPLSLYLVELSLYDEYTIVLEKEKKKKGIKYPLYVLIVP